MRRKFAFLVAVFCATVLAMAVQKPVFMAWYAAEASRNILCKSPLIR